MNNFSNKYTLTVVGLGYVGLPLAIEFGKIFKTYGFDLSEKKISSYNKFVDPNKEISRSEFKKAENLIFTNQAKCIKGSHFIIVTVPTPVDNTKIPDFSYLHSACEIIGSNLQPKSIIVFESTVYPGATEEVCVPIIEKISKLKWKKDFFVGYSPERLNPGDKEHSLKKIVKVVSGDSINTTNEIKRLYSAIIDAGIHVSSSIKVAEAAKVIENTQRDLNIALMNELSIICSKIEINTAEVLEAASTKWNFLKFSPGLVGGHCIDVDPYYLTYKSQMLGYKPDVILAGRKINDGMGKFIAENVIKSLIKSGEKIKGKTVNIFGLTFKENCTDLRNSRVFDIINELKEYDINVNVHDPIADKKEAKKIYNIDLIDWEKIPKSQAVIIAVAHEEYKKIKLEGFISKLYNKGFIFDIKSIFYKNKLPRSFNYWSL